MQIYDYIFEIIKILLPFIGLVIGWFVVSHFQDIRERRKEIRGLIEEAKELIQEIYSLTLVYYSSKNKSAINETSSQIKFKLMFLSQYMIVINQAGLKTEGDLEMTNLHKIATGDVFETANFKNRISDDQWRSELSLAANELAFLLDKKYFASYKIKSMPPHLATTQLL